MKKLIFSLFILSLVSHTIAQELKPISLLTPDKTRGLPVMQALSVKASVREWSSISLSLQDLSDLLWAANGINRPDGKRTASSAQNAQDIDIYVFMTEGVYLYNAANSSLDPIVAGNYLDLPGKTDAPVNLVLVTDISRFRSGTDSIKLAWGHIDVGIVSQNISLFCAGTGMKTRPRATFPGKDKIPELLKLKSSQFILLNHPVGYGKEE